MASQVHLGPGNRRGEQRDVGEIAKNDHREQRPASPVDAPTDHAVRHLEGEAPHRRAIVETQAECRECAAWPEGDVPRVCDHIEDEMRDDADSDGSAEQRPAKSFLGDQPRQQRRAGGRGD